MKIICAISQYASNLTSREYTTIEYLIGYLIIIGFFVIAYTITALSRDHIKKHTKIYPFLSIVLPILWLLIPVLFFDSINFIAFIVAFFILMWSGMVWVIIQTNY